MNCRISGAVNEADSCLLMRRAGSKAVARAKELHFICRFVRLYSHCYFFIIFENREASLFSSEGWELQSQAPLAQISRSPYFRSSHRNFETW